MGYIPYILFYIICLLSYFLFQNKILKKAKVIFVILPIFSFFLLAILKSSNVGIDSSTYEAMYYELSNLTITTFFKRYISEAIFYLPMYLLSILGFNFIFFKIYIYGTIAILLFFSLKKYENPITMFVILMGIGFFSMSFSAMRQGLAMGFVLCGINFLVFETKTKKIFRDFIPPIIFFLLAALSHNSAIICFLLLLFIFPNFSKINLIQLTLFIPFLISIAAGFVIFLSYIFHIDYVTYNSRLSLRFVLYLFILLFSLLISNRSLIKKNKLDRLLNDFNFGKNDSFMYLVALLCAILASFNVFSQVFTRFSFYFLISIAYLISRILNLISNKKLKTIFNCLIILVMGLYFIYDCRTLGLYPYEICF